MSNIPYHVHKYTRNQNVWSFSQWENRNLCHTLKTTDLTFENLGFVVLRSARVIPFKSDSLSLVWDYVMHFAKFPVLRFQKAATPIVLIRFLWK